jgi:hypothetical protein
MQKRDNRMSALIKSQNDELNALNSRFEAMKNSLNERYARELAQIKQKHKVQQNALKSREMTAESMRAAAAATKH